MLAEVAGKGKKKISNIEQGISNIELRVRRTPRARGRDSFEFLVLSWD